VVWHAYRGAEKAAFEKVVGMFEKSPGAKGMKVSTLAIPYDAYADKISAAVPRGKGPDVFIYAQDRLGGWIEAGKTVEPIDFFVDKATRDSLLPGMLGRHDLQGRRLRPADQLQDAHADLQQGPRQGAAQDHRRDGQAGQDADQCRSGPLRPGLLVHQLLLPLGADERLRRRVFDKDGKLVVNSPATVASLNQMMTWYKKDGIMPTEPSEALIASMFNEGKVAMVINGPWFVGDIDKKINVGFAPLPVRRRGEEADAALDDDRGRLRRRQLGQEGRWPTSSPST
jgi:arabinogalactan oligomer/maltooligosaccharide transport system substrate-binding protein